MTLFSTLNLKVNATAILNANIDVGDRLLNAQGGTVKHCKFKNDIFVTIQIELYDCKAGLKRTSTEDSAR